MKEMVDTGIILFGCPLYFESPNSIDTEELQTRIVSYVKSLLPRMKSKEEYRQMVREKLGTGGRHG